MRTTVQRTSSNAGTNDAIRIGVSPCLLGQNVRYDGEHAREPLVVDTLGRLFEWITSCPEVEIGLGVPRPPIQLERADSGIRLVMPSTGADLTTKMTRFCRARAKELASQDLAGYIFKSRSPSCGIHHTKLFSSRGSFRRIGRGFFAAEMMHRYPLLPVITETNLRDPIRRLGWIARVFATIQLRRLWQSRWKPADLWEFHESYALTLQAHSVTAERRLRNVLDQAGTKRELRAAYEPAFHQALDRPTSRAKQLRVMKKVVRGLRESIAVPERREIESTLHKYEIAQLPLVEPLSILRHYAQRTPHQSLAGCNYLFPDPREWILRAELGL